MVAAEEAKALEGIEREMLGDGDIDAFVSLPAVGLSAEDVLQRATTLQAADLHDEAQVKKWGGVYHINTAEHKDELFDLQADVWKLFNATNALYPMVFKAVRKFQAEIVEMMLHMLRAKDASGAPCGAEVGLLTSGGTESICLAMYALKKYAAKTRGVSQPEVIACDSAHGALDKACAYFDIKLVKVEPGTDFRMRVEDVQKHLNRNTVCVYTSAPSFPHGVMDPIEAIAAVCAAANVPVHVDNCMGGIVASMCKAAGLMKAEFDFNLPGVTTMSVDCHKFGQASKGASVVAFRDNVIRQCSYTPVLDWSGGFYVTPTMQGSRNGAIIASAWATLVHKGEAGYMRTARNVHATLQRGIAAVNAIPQLKVAGNPDLCMLPMVWADDKEATKIYAVAAGMSKRGWGVATLQRPPCINITVAEQYMWSLDAFVKDLTEVAAEVAQVPVGELSGVAGVYGSAAVMPDDKMENALMAFCDMQMRVKPRTK
jgi:glutamate/tyrosine decarboxylase-like PLP-dependent enzyme